MPKFSLPDDLDKWPTNPFDLLGIDRDIAPRDARRAYLCLVRLFKPEHQPEHFKKIREAFEAVEADLELRDLFRAQENGLQKSGPVPGDEWSPRITPRFNEFGDVSSLENGGTSKAKASRISFDDSQSLETAWDLACNGDRATAYRQLVAMLQRRPDESGAYLRLYWLLVADPQLDVQRKPCDWLYEGLKKTRLAWPLLNLYRREIRRNPKEALSARCEELLDVTTDEQMLYQLLLGRWELFFLQFSCKRISQDVDRIRRHFIFDSQSHWLRLLMRAASYLAFAPDETKTFKVFHAEIESLMSLHKDMGDEFDRMDELTILTKEWSGIQMSVVVPQKWTSLVPFGWLELYDAARGRLLALLQEITQQPKASLRIADRLSREYPLAMHQILNLIAMHGQRQNKYWPNRDPEELGVIILRSLYPWWSLGLGQFREVILEFCLREAVLPRDVARIADEVGTQQNAECGWCVELFHDISMQTICLAHSVFEN